jgi:hypothetical protein
MIRRNAVRTFLLAVALAAAAGPVSAQLQDNLLGLSDANLAAYLDPLQGALSGTLNSAVFRSGFVPRQELELTVGVAAMAVSFNDGDRTYRPADPPGFTSLQPADVPTVIGPLTGTVVPGQDGLTRIYPGGFNLDGFELAVPQASIGCLFGTRLLVRYFAIDLGDSGVGSDGSSGSGDSDLKSFKYYGIGGQHSVSQWFPTLPVDLAAGAFYQDFKLGDDTVRLKALQLNLTASRQFGILQPYAGLGYDTIRLDVHAVDADEPANSVSLSLERRSNAHLTLGLLARLRVLALYGEFNAGAGTGFALGLDLGTIGGASHAVRHAR